MPQDFSPQIARLYKLYVFYKNNRILVSVHNLEIEIGRHSYADNTMAKRKRTTFYFESNGPSLIRPNQVFELQGVIKFKQMKNNKFHTVGTVSKSTRKIVERGKIEAPNAHINSAHPIICEGRNLLTCRKTLTISTQNVVLYRPYDRFLDNCIWPYIQRPRLYGV
jgi:hypothetical protein